MTSHLVADYSAWAFLVFQPVDSAIIEEIKQERGVPEQAIIDGLFWQTPTGINTTSPNVEPQQSGLTATADQVLNSTPQATSDSLPASLTAFQPSYTSTPMPTGILSLPEPTEISNPTMPPKPMKPPKSETRRRVE